MPCQASALSLPEVPAAVVLFGNKDRLFISGYPSAPTCSPLGKDPALTYRDRACSSDPELVLVRRLPVFVALLVVWSAWFCASRPRVPPLRVRRPVVTLAVHVPRRLYRSVTARDPALSGERVSRGSSSCRRFPAAGGGRSHQRVSRPRAGTISARDRSARDRDRAVLAAQSHAWSLPLLERSWPAPAPRRALGIAIPIAGLVPPPGRGSVFIVRFRGGVARRWGALGWALRGRRLRTSRCRRASPRGPGHRASRCPRFAAVRSRG